MKILFGIPEKTAKGGVNACEPPFISAMQKLENIEIFEEIYVFDNRHNPSFFERIKRVLNTAWKFRKLLKKEKFAVVHLNTAFDFKAILRDFITLKIIKNSDAKIFLKMHGSEAKLLQETNFLKRFLWQKTLQMVDAIGVLSSEEKENFVKASVSDTKVFVVKNAVEQAEKFERYFSQKPIRLLFVSRLIFTKGLLETIKATLILKEKGFDIWLDVLGDGEMLNIAKAEVKANQAEDFIKFYGHISEEKVKEFYRNSDILVFPTFHEEGFPMVIFNALSYGLPIVTTEIRAAKDYLENGENCLFCKAKNAENFAEKIEILLNDEILRKSISNNNFNLAKEFSAEKIAQEYLEIYRKL
jgi:glycosyltransferase involved in cell wall biosynthesis